MDRFAYAAMLGDLFVQVSGKMNSVVEQANIYAVNGNDEDIMPLGEDEYTWGKIDAYKEVADMLYRQMIDCRM